MEAGDPEDRRPARSPVVRPETGRGADRGPARLGRPDRPQARDPQRRRRDRGRPRPRGRDRRRGAGDGRQGRERDQGRGRVAARPGLRQQQGGLAGDRGHDRRRSTTASTSSRPGRDDRLQPAHLRLASSRSPRTTSRSCAARSPTSRTTSTRSRPRRRRPRTPAAPTPTASSAAHPPALGRALDGRAGPLGDAVVAALLELGLELVDDVADLAQAVGDRAVAGRDLVVDLAARRARARPRGPRPSS